ncbi:hypothetical protein C1886_22645 [Pseudomonas sp. FW300-N1A1]|nr:hypothetical protein C1886_22645 [Pseudomonas sp. FW300-N1A1]
MDVNDYAYVLSNCVVLEFIASGLAPAEVGVHGQRFTTDQNNKKSVPKDAKDSPLPKEQGASKGEGLHCKTLA